MPNNLNNGLSAKPTFRQLGRPFIILINVLVSVLIIWYGLAAWQTFKAIGGESKLQITLSGEGKVSAKPDVARFTATILTEAESLPAAQKENSEKSQALAGYLKGAGIEEKDLRTSGYNVYPQYSSPRPCLTFPCPLGSESSKIIGYQIRNSYELSIRDLAKAGEILAGVVAFGANEVSGIAFTIDKPENLKAEAREKAIDNAREKAEKLAEDLDRRLGKIVSFSESGGFPPPIFLSREAALAKGGDFGGEAAPAIKPGEDEIVVNVSITYEFK